ncbi:hypothetical protein Tco_0961762 [Tanacetum coccineum]
MKSLRQNAVKKLRQNAVKKLRQNAVKRKILPDKTQPNIEAKRSDGLEAKRNDCLEAKRNDGLEAKRSPGFRQNATKYPVLIDQLIRRIHQLDTTYQPFYSEQRINLCNLNNVSVLPNNTAYSVKSIRRVASEWFKKDCIGSFTTWKDLVEKFVQKFYQLSNNNEEMEAEESYDPDDIAEIFNIEGNLFDYETPLCKAFNDFNYLLKIDTNLFTFDIQGIRTYEEYELNNTVTRDLEEPWLNNGVPYQLCDHKCEPYRFKNGMTKWPTCSSDIDGFCNGGELPGMVRVECMTYF